LLNGFLPLPNPSRFPGDDRGNVFFGEITGGAQLEPGAPLELEPEQELTRGVWSAFAEDLETEAAQRYQPALQDQDKRQKRGRAKGATATTKGIRR